MNDQSQFRVVANRGGSRSFTDQGRGGNSYHGPQRRGGYNKKNSYNRRGGGGYNRPKGRGGPNPRTRLDGDGDVCMDNSDNATSHRNRYAPYNSKPQRGGGRYGGRKLAMDEESSKAMHRLGLPVNRSDNYRGGRGNNNNRGRSDRIKESSSGWYKITIPHGKRSEKDFILKSITNVSDVPFFPYHFHYEQNTAIFYVNDLQAANAIRNVSRRITTLNGFKMVIITSPSSAPSFHLDPQIIEKMKVCMSSRYDPTSMSLNLSRLFYDDELKKDGIHLALNRPNVMSEATKIIQEHIPELKTLDLSDNRLQTLSMLSSVPEKTPNLRCLNLGRNQLKHESELDCIKNWKLEELMLDRNPLCDRFTNESLYVSTIRKKFPKITKLDGHVLPPPITFDVEEATSLPVSQILNLHLEQYLAQMTGPSKGNYFTDPQSKELVIRFLQQYMSIYDGDNRQTLVDAYHDNAIFSLCAGHNRLVMSKQPPFYEYSKENRNLMRVHDNNRRQKTLKMGKINVVAFLNQLPRTQHDLGSFVVDILHSSPHALSFVVHGIFKERSTKSDMTIMRAFSRVFVTISQGSGMAIVNEQLTVSSPTPDQVQDAFKTPTPTPSSSPAPLPQPAVPAPSAVSPTVTADVQQAMVRQFTVQSGMNEEWSAKCLAENNWDYAKSATVFTDLHSKKAIPPEAFVK